MTDRLAAFRERIKINQNRPLPQVVKEEKQLAEIDLSFFTNEVADKHGLELVPRETVKKLVAVPLDTNFTFRVRKNDGENYISAMRQVLSRVRKKAKKAKYILDEFKLFLVGINLEHKEYDEITLVRSKRLTPQQESLYDDLVVALRRVDLERR